MVADVDAAAEPSIRRVQLGQGLDLAGAALAFAGRVHPQGEQDLGVDGGCAGDAIARFDRGVQRREVEPSDDGPDGAGRVVFWKLRIQVEGPPAELLAGGPLAAGRRACGCEAR